MSIRSIATIHHTLTPDTGDVWETIFLQQSIVHQILVKSATSTTIFDVVLENSHGDEVFRVNDNTGIMVEELKLPFAENGTVKILNATVDELFTYNITVEE